ncbi:OsmC family protein [Jidongwangia harbinensis]|uniref:OsmC family protein n=1 Tax=Jidongwangia harbinensis TaxID=2878561 RepID=UPI001CD97F64|nr:OsmC family protein [Jidongwangia harbinensis]MCA2219000.1 OsmC family protein [Jidongwangia harbinensis]
MTHTTAADVELLDVTPCGGEQYEIEVRGHRIRVDQPATDGGADLAPTPTELFVASLAACVAYYAGRYLTRHGFDRAGMQVRAGFAMASDRPARVASIRIVVHPPAGFPAERIPALAAVASHCTVHNSLTDPPRIDLRVG